MIGYIKKIAGCCAAAAAAIAAFPLLARGQSILKVSAVDFPGYTRVTIASAVPLSYTLDQSTDGLHVKLEAKVSYRFQGEAVRSRLVKSFGWAKTKAGYDLLIETRNSDFRVEHANRRDPVRLEIDLFPPGEKPAEKPAGKPAAEIRKDVRGEEKKEEPPRQPALPSPSSSPRGMRTIVLDPGHGGVEVGAKGKFGSQEKDITLAVSLKLKTLIEQNLAFRVVLTRDKDVDMSLDNRAALANNNKADLFISVHVNGSFQKIAHGSETFFLSQNATDEESRRLAYLENNATESEKGIGETSQDDIKLILWDLAQAAYLKQSSKLAEIIQNQLNTALGTTNRGIKQAPFKVLTGVACPAVLVEAAFISNPEEEEKLKSEEFQNQIAEAVFRGLVEYSKIYS